jgi:hypothetical protein
MHVLDRDREIIILSEMVGDLLTRIEFLSPDELTALRTDIVRWMDGANDANIHFIEAVEAYIDAQLEAQ